MVEEQLENTGLRTDCRSCNRMEQCPVSEVLKRINELEEKVDRLNKFNQEFHYNLGS